MTDVFFRVVCTKTCIILVSINITLDCIIAHNSLVIFRSVRKDRCNVFNDGEGEGGVDSEVCASNHIQCQGACWQWLQPNWLISRI